MDKFLVKRSKSSSGEVVKANNASGNDELEASNRFCLKVVLDTTRLHLRQGWPFRLLNEFMDPDNRGNFIEFIEFFTKENPDMLKVRSLNAAGYSHMTSPLVQNQMIKACAVETTQAIVREIGDSPFALLVYECRGLEQIGVILRYVNKRGEVIERFLATIDVADVSPVCLKDAIDTLFTNSGLSLSRLRGQGYGSIENLNDETHGLKSLILKDNPSAKYVHCFAQHFDLVVMSVAQALGHICELFMIVGRAAKVSGSICKIEDKQLRLEHDRIVRDLESGGIFNDRGRDEESSSVKPTDTRWGSHYVTLTKLVEMWPSVIQVLDNISYDGIDMDDRGTAGFVFPRIESYDLVFNLHLMKNVLGITNELSLCLQERDKSIIQAMQELETFKFQLKDFKENGFEKLMQELESFCKLYEIPVPNMEDTCPRLVRMKRDGKVVTNDHHYRVERFCKVLDLIEKEIESRFPETSVELLTCVACLDPRDSFSKFNHDKLVRLAELYPDDFSPVSRRVLSHQLEDYICYMRKDSEFSDIQDLESLSKKMVEKGLDIKFSEVYRLIKLALVLPIAAASVEKEFSAMREVIAELQNDLGDECTSDSLLVYIEKEVFEAIDNKTILQRFQTLQT